MATTPFKVATLDKVARLRFKEGDAQSVRHLPMTASKTVRKGDVLMYSSGSTGPVERYITPSATGGNVKFGAAGKTLVGIALEDKTTGASVTNRDTLAVAPKERVQFLARLVSNDSAGDDAAAAGGATRR